MTRKEFLILGWKRLIRPVLIAGALVLLYSFLSALSRENVEINLSAIIGLIVSSLPFTFGLMLAVLVIALIIHYASKVLPANMVSYIKKHYRVFYIILIVVASSLFFLYKVSREKPFDPLVTIVAAAYLSAGVLSAPKNNPSEKKEA